MRSALDEVAKVTLDTWVCKLTYALRSIVGSQTGCNVTMEYNGRTRAATQTGSAIIGRLHPYP